MFWDWMGYGFAALAFAGAAVTAVLILGHVYLIGLHLALRRGGLADEARRLAQPLPPDAALPHVVVQIPVFNEGAIVERGIAAAARLDWPKDRLHIQVCDDSTDKTTALAHAAARRAAEAGIDVEVLHRTDRGEFKAGALRAAMAATGHGYFAIFDVDYVPPEDFLRRCMTVLLADPKLAFVQARPDFLNAEENALTRAQAIMLDAHHAIEQATRSWAGFPLPFNGTCGIWRRAAIEAGGGWLGETLAEDMDLSYRAWFAGWRGIFLTTVAVPGELPAERTVWAAQQRRWTMGLGQVAMKMLPVVWRHGRLPWRGRVAAAAHLGTWWSVPISSVTVQATVIAAALRPQLIPVLGTMLAIFVLTGNVVAFLNFRIANRLLRKDAASLMEFTRDFFRICALGTYLGWVNGDVPRKVMRRKKSAFERTAKAGAPPEESRLT